MKNLPLYEKLDSSFVNLSALVRYLRERHFVGTVRFELDGYEADITLGEKNELKVHEHDRVAGRIAEGEEAFQRLLIRAREPGGSIDVYRADNKNEESAPQAALRKDNVKPFVHRETFVPPPPTAPGFEKSTTDKSAAPLGSREKAGDNQKPVPRFAESAPAPQTAAPLPLEFSNRVEEKARQPQLTPQEWQTFLQLTGELLGAVDKTLAAANLDFATAFEKARAEISGDYPFLNPVSGAFDYANGRITMREQPNAKLFAASINEALRRILDKLGTNPKFAGVYRDAVQTLLALIHHRKTFYDKFFITPQLEKNLGA